jgi:hypothetical protein
MKANISPLATKPNKHASNELCTCFSLAQTSRSNKKEQMDEYSVFISQELQSRVHALAQSFFSRAEALSVLVLHIVQPEEASSRIAHKRKRYHASPEILQQVLASVQRTIRVDDNMLLYGVAGIAIIFPDVDRLGMTNIAERIYRSICLLQAETLVPPLKRETTIVLGIGTYPDPAATLDMLYQQVGHITHSLTLRPVITTQRRGCMPLPIMELAAEQLDYWNNPSLASIEGSVVPYMKLPRTLPKQLTQLIPYQIAYELQCAPVGREHQRLTVAMREPSNHAAIARLREITGLTIFPVTCKENELNNLLRCSW